MKVYQRIVFILIASVCASSYAACRSEAAAIQGAQYGYNRDKTAAIENEKRENASSNVLGRCVGSISSILVVPVFPSLGDIFTKAAEKACRVASDKIREATKIPTLEVPGVPTTAIPIQFPITPPPAPGKKDTTGTFWNRIWR